MLISGDSLSAGTFAKYLWSLLGDGLGTEKPWCCHVEQSDGKGICKYLPGSSYMFIACLWFFLKTKQKTNKNQPKEREEGGGLMMISNFI